MESSFISNLERLLLEGGIRYDAVSPFIEDEDGQYE